MGAAGVLSPAGEGHVASGVSGYCGVGSGVGFLSASVVCGESAKPGVRVGAGCRDRTVPGVFTTIIPCDILKCSADVAGMVIIAQ